MITKYTCIICTLTCCELSQRSALLINNLKLILIFYTYKINSLAFNILSSSSNTTGWQQSWKTSLLTKHNCYNGSSIWTQALTTNHLDSVRQTTCHVRRYVSTNTRVQLCRLYTGEFKDLSLTSVDIICIRQNNSILCVEESEEF